MLFVCSIAVLMSLFFTLDLIVAPKKGKYYVRNFVSLVGVTVPGIYESVANTNSEILGHWNEYFFPSFGISFLVFMTVAYIAFYHRLMNDLHRQDGVVVVFTFMTLLEKGYSNFQDEVNKEIKKAVANNSRIITTGLNAMAEHIPRYFEDLLLALVDKEDDYDLEDYVQLVLFSFIEHFLNHNDARFTLRAYDSETDSMVATLCTSRDTTPSPIPVSKKNLITLSMQKKLPLLYSMNKDHHFETNGSIKGKKYDDYVTYCIVSDRKKPLISLNLEVKGKSNVKRLKAMVTSTIFTIVCDAIKVKYLVMSEQES